MNKEKVILRISQLEYLLKGVTDGIMVEYLEDIKKDYELMLQMLEM